MAWLTCEECGEAVDRSTRRCPQGHHVTSEHLLGVLSTVDHAAHEVGPRQSHASFGFGDGDDSALNGKRFGKFVVEGMLGRGGMGAVYRAKHEELGHYAAIKVIDRRLGSQDVITRLFREARAAAQIGHVNIVQVFDFGRDPDVGGYIVMELLQGRPLEEVVAKGHALDEARVVAIAIEICDALIAAHGKGIVHRDLKPANVFLQETANGDRVKIMDFGIAKVAESLGESATQPGTILGTPRYMSPEQWCGEAVDARSDVYSFGVMLYRMVTGALPFPKATTLPQLGRVVTQPLSPRPREVRAQVSETLERIILKCCAPAKEERYASMTDVLADLRALGRTGAASGGSSRARGDRDARKGRRTTWAALALAGVAATGLFAFRGGAFAGGSRSDGAPAAVRSPSSAVAVAATTPPSAVEAPTPAVSVAAPIVHATAPGAPAVPATATTPVAAPNGPAARPPPVSSARTGARAPTNEKDAGAIPADDLLFGR